MRPVDQDFVETPICRLFRLWIVFIYEISWLQSTRQGESTHFHNLRVSEAKLVNRPRIILEFSRFDSLRLGLACIIIMSNVCCFFFFCAWWDRSSSFCPPAIFPDFSSPSSNYFYCNQKVISVTKKQPPYRTKFSSPWQISSLLSSW